MIQDVDAPTGRTPRLAPACPGGPVLVYAGSGLGKSTLAASHPSRVLDAVRFLYAAVQEGFPQLEPRARLRAWRELCQVSGTGGEALARWAAIRRGFVEPFVSAMHAGTHPLVVTSVLSLPWFVSAYYGVERGQYLEHLRLAGRLSDNHQSEAMNDRLEGYSPLVRLAAGSFLGERAELRALIEGSG